MSDIHNEEPSAFVTSTLNAISLGIAEAAQVGIFRFDIPSKIEFEVAVTATKAKEGGGGLKISVFSAEGKARAEDDRVSRIRFEVGRVNSGSVGPLNTTGLRKGIV